MLPHVPDTCLENQEFPCNTFAQYWCLSSFLKGFVEVNSTLRWANLMSKFWTNQYVTTLLPPLTHSCKLLPRSHFFIQYFWSNNGVCLAFAGAKVAKARAFVEILSFYNGTVGNVNEEIAFHNGTNLIYWGKYSFF